MLLSSAPSGILINLSFISAFYFPETRVNFKDSSPYLWGIYNLVEEKRVFLKLFHGAIIDYKSHPKSPTSWFKQNNSVTYLEEHHQVELFVIMEMSHPITIGDCWAVEMCLVWLRSWILKFISIWIGTYRIGWARFLSCPKIDKQ